jgi:hypothetical protein
MHVTNAQAPGCATNLAREAEGNRLNDRTRSYTGAPYGSGPLQ